MTYNNHRERRKTVIAHNFDARSLDEHSDQGSVATPTKQRKLSKYGAEAQVSLKPIEGSWVLVGSDNYRAYLRAIGAGRYSVDLAMRAATIIRIHQVQLSLTIIAAMLTISFRNLTSSGGLPLSL